MVSRESPAERSGRASAGALILAAGLCGGSAGLLAALFDIAWSAGDLGQYLPGLVGKLELLVHLALSYAFAGSLVGMALALAYLALRDSALFDLPGSLLARSKTIDRAAINSLLLTGLPMLVVTASIAYPHALRQLVTRRHVGLVIFSAIAIAWIAIALGVLATFAIAAVSKGRLTRLVGTPSPWLVAGVMAVASAGAGYALWHRELGALPFRTLWVYALPLIAVPLTPLLARRLLLAMDRSQRPTDLHLAVSAHILVSAPLLAAGLLASSKLALAGADATPAFLVARAMASATLLLCAIIIAIVISARLVLMVLRTRGGGRLARALGARRSPALLALGLSAVAVAAAVILWWPTLRLLFMMYGRFFSAVVVMLAGFWLLRPVSRRLATRIGPLRRLRHGLATLLCLALAFAAMVATGAAESVRKAQVLHTGLGEPLAKVYRLAGDWDRDGYSRWLGGGDCDDYDGYVHPNADEIPGDGIDNNCNAGDATMRTASDTRFADLPPGIPEDFNVVLISIDTIRADHLGAYGYQRDITPNLDELAAGGTLFKNAWAHAPSTRYSIPALLTGRHPLSVRYFDIPRQWPGLSEENLTIAEVLQARGLRTGAILNYWYFDPLRKMNQGFEHYDNQNKRLHHPVAGEGPAKTSGSSSKEQTDKAIEYVASKASERFFLWVHYYDPHYDYETHEGIPRFGSSKIDGYDHEIAFTDQHIGRLLDDLKARGLYDKTVIVVTGDHGEGFGEHGIDLHGYHLYAAQTKVPLIIRVPGTEPSVVTTPASHVDVLPTLANLSGYASSADMLGRSLLGLITGAEDREQERYVFQQLSYENNNEYRAAVSAKCHIMFNVSPNLSWELYRIDKDPMEEHDIIDHPGECADARGVLEAWYDDSQIPEGAIEALLDSAPAIDAPLNIDFGRAIRLLELQMPKTVRRGASFEMSLLWQARGRPPAGWKVFAHFESEVGRFTGDHKPLRPFTWWRDGQHIRYQHRVNIPQALRPGRYTLWMGIYKGSDRMSVRGSDVEVVDRRLRLGEIEVLP